MTTEGPGDRFAAELARLKRRGSGVLVSDGGGGIGVCTELLGSESERRVRVVARAAGSAVLPVPPEGGNIVDVTPSDTRSAAVGGERSFDPAAVARRIETPEDIATVTSAVADEVDRVASDVDPGELRVCLGRLDPYLERESIEVVADSVAELVDRVRDCRGMVHAHAAGAVPEALARVFDVTVETRTTPSGFHQQRWHLHAADVDTDWLQKHAP